MYGETSAIHWIIKKAHETPEWKQLFAKKFEILYFDESKKRKKNDTLAFVCKNWNKIIKTI